MICSRSSSATTEGTRFSPSSPGMTTGVSPCMCATREFVVPGSMPTMRSVLIAVQIADFRLQIENQKSAISNLKSAFQHLVHIPDQIPDVVPPVQQVDHLVPHPVAIFLATAVHDFVPLVPIGLQFVR